MAVLKNGILGGISGKVSGVVGFNIFGKDVIRGYSKPANPRTTSQTNQRSKFKASLVFAQSILSSVINEYWRGFKSGMSPFNAFMGVNIPLADATGVITKDQQILRGSLELGLISNCEYNTVTGEFVMDWDTTCIGNGLSTDNVLAIAWDTVNKIGFVDDGGETRASAGITISAGTGRTATDMVGFVAFYRGTSPDYLVSNTSGDDAVAS